MHSDVDLIERRFKTKARQWIKRIEAMYKARKAREEKQHRPLPRIRVEEVFGDPRKTREEKYGDYVAKQTAVKYIERSYSDHETVFETRFQWLSLLYNEKWLVFSDSSRK